jgi:hypothetical protein
LLSEEEKRGRAKDKVTRHGIKKPKRKLEWERLILSSKSPSSFLRDRLWREIKNQRQKEKEKCNAPHSQKITGCFPG